MILLQLLICHLDLLLVLLELVEPALLVERQLDAHGLELRDDALVDLAGELPVQVRLLDREVDERVDRVAEGLLLVVLVLVDAVGLGHGDATGLRQGVQVRRVLGLQVDATVQEGDHGAEGLLRSRGLGLDQINVVLKKKVRGGKRGVTRNSTANFLSNAPCLIIYYFLINNIIFKE